MMSPGRVHAELGEEESARLGIQELRFQQAICTANELQLDVEPLHPHINHLHARQAEPGRNHATRDRGVIDFRRIVDRLRADGWHGVICLEYFTRHIENPQEEIRWLKGELERFLGER